MEKEIARLNEIREEIKKLYSEKKVLETKIVETLIVNKEKVITFNQNEIITLSWVFDKKIDYEKLKTKYPDVYTLGIVPSFSAKQALLSLDSKTFNKILKDCTTSNPHYILKTKGNNKNGNK